jgi:acyl-coenzyme A thioesterase PaaI-like protein
MALVHHELCFGCGRTNLFGLLLEVVQTGPGSIAGRCFIKQDHQGADRGYAHEGIVAAGLSEAMALACGHDARAVSVEVRFAALAPVGEFLRIEAHVVQSMEGTIRASATASAEERFVAEAGGTYEAR